MRAIAALVLVTGACSEPAALTEQQYLDAIWRPPADIDQDGVEADADCPVGQTCECVTVDHCAVESCYTNRACEDRLCVRDSKPDCTTCKNTADCADDGSLCTIEGCDDAGECTRADRDCDDQRSCTNDTCDPSLGCQHADTCAAPVVTLPASTSATQGTVRILGSYEATTEDGETLGGWVKWGTRPGEDWEPLALDGENIALEHDYPRPGEYVVSVEVRDQFGRVGAGSIALVVENADPNIALDPTLLLSIDEGGDFELRASVHDLGGVEGIEASIDFGDGTVVAGTISALGVLIPSSHRFRQDSDDGTLGVTLTVTDGEGGTAVATHQLAVKNVTPFVTKPGVTSIDEGISETLELPLNEPGDDELELEINIGTQSIGYDVKTLENGAKVLVLELLYPDNGTQSVTYFITDEPGSQVQDSFPIEVKNVAPEITPLAALAGNEGALVTGVVAFTDPGDDATEWGATVDYGDGTGEKTVQVDRTKKTLNLSHAYADDGDYTITVEVKDALASDAQTIDVAVGNVAPSVNAGDDETIDEGDVLTRTRTITDAGDDTFTATVSYAGESAVALAVAANDGYTLSHLYAQDGAYTVTVAVTDDDGSQISQDFTVTVENVAPVVGCGATVGHVDEGEAFTRECTISDVGADTLAVTVDYDDGRGPRAAAIDADGKLELDHAWPDEGNYDVVLSASDDDTSTAVTLTIGVGDVPPLVSAGADATLIEGGTFTRTGTVAAAVASDALSATVDYGDGSGTSALALNAAGDFSLSHLYQQDGVFTVTVTATGPDGADDKGSDTVKVTVSNAAPVVSAGADTAIDEGGSVVRNVTVTDAGIKDTLVATIDAGLGGTTQITVPASGIVPLNLSYPQDGAYTVTVTVSDGTAMRGSDSFQVVVTNIAPTLGALAAASANEGAEVSRSVTITDPGADDTFSASIDWGDGGGLQALASVVSGVAISHVYADNGTFQVTVSINDGVDTSSTGFSATIGNTSPSLAAGTLVAALEGSAWTFNGTVVDPGSGDTFAGSVRWEAAGTFESFPANAGAISVGHTYAQDGSYAVRVQVNDDDGGSTFVDATAVVNNAAPVLELGDAAALDEGATFTRSVSFTDAGADSWTADIDYGDGTTVADQVVQRGVAFDIGHTWRDEGVFTVTVAIDDGDGGVTSDSFQVTVANVAPTVSAGGPTTVAEGGTLTRAGSFTDPGVDDSFSATVDWGTGGAPESLVLSGKTFQLSHVYPGNGIFHVTVDVADDAGAHGSAGFDVTVSNSAPAVNGGADTSIVEGATFGRLVTFSDSGADDWSATVDWDDGSLVEPSPVDDALKRVTLSHQYRDEGTYVVLVTVFDGTESGQASFLLDVTNATPVVSLGADGSVNEGATFSRGGSFTDAGPDDVHTGTVTWGDGGAAEALSIDNRAFNISHSWPDNGQRTVQADVTDGDATGNDTLVVTVNNVAPTIATHGEVTRNAAQRWQSSVGFTDPGADTWTATVDYKDGAIVNVGAVTGSVTLDHTWQTPGTYDVVVTVTDDDTGSDSETISVTVNNVAPTLVPGTDVSVNEGSLASLAATFVDPGTNTHTATIKWTSGGANLAATVDEQAKTVSGTHTYTQQGIYNPLITLTDTTTSPNLNDTDSTMTVTVSNVPPSFEAGAGETIDEGGTFTRSFGFTDPGADDWSGQVNWGQGAGLGTSGISVDDANKLVELSHVYADDRSTPFSVSVQVQDDTITTSDGFAVTVRNVAPVVSIGTGATINEGATYSQAGSFTDPGANDPHNNASVTWLSGGQSESLALNGSNFSLSHLYPENGDFTVTATIPDDDTSGSAQVVVHVQNVAPTIANPGTQNVNAGQAWSANVAFSDPGTLDTFTATVDYNDGGGVQNLGSVTSPIALSHTWAGYGSKSVVLKVTDDDGDSHERTITVNVANVPPTVAGGSDKTIDEGSSVTISGTYADTGTDTHTMSITWESGGTAETFSVTGGTFSRNHTYTTDGVRDVVVKVIDSGDLFATDSVQVTVGNKIPVVSAGAAARAIPDGHIQRVITFTDPGADTWTAEVAWGDGNSQSVTVDQQNKSISIDHTYTSTAKFTVTVTVDDGGVTDGTGSFEVDARLLDCDDFGDIAGAASWIGGAAAGAINWHLAANWHPVGVPVASTPVIICKPLDGAFVNDQPAFSSSDVEVASVHMHPEVDISVGGASRKLTVAGDLIGGAVLGTGTVVMNGANATLASDVVNLDIDAATKLGADVDVTGALDVDASFDLDGHVLTVAGAAVIASSASKGLKLTASGSEAIFASSLSLSGVADPTRMTAGTIRLRGNMVGTFATGAPFASGGTAVIFDGTLAQSMNLGGGTANVFADLTFANLVGVNLLSSVRVDGQLTVNGPLTAGAGVVAELRGTSLPVKGPSGSYGIATTEIRGTIALAADYAFTSAAHHLVIKDDGALSIGARSLTLAGDLTVYHTGAIDQGLLMKSSSSNVEVGGDAIFAMATDGTGSNGQLTGGTLEIQGSLSAVDTLEPGGIPLWANGTNVRFDGTSGTTHVVRIESAVLDSVVVSGQRTLDFGGDDVVVGSLVHDGPSTATFMNAAELTADDASLDQVIFDDCPFVIDGATVTSNLDNAVFRNFAGTDVQLRVSANASGLEWDFTNLDFLVRPTGEGRYIVGSSTAGAVQLNVLESSPLYGEPKVNVSGGFTINWGDVSDDSDGDDLTDAEELANLAGATDPLDADTDGDGFEDGFEHFTGSSAVSAASVPFAFLATTSVALPSGSNPTRVAVGDLIGDATKEIVVALGTLASNAIATITKLSAGTLVKETDVLRGTDPNNGQPIPWAGTASVAIGDVHPAPGRELVVIDNNSAANARITSVLLENSIWTQRNNAGGNQGADVAIGQIVSDGLDEVVYLRLGLTPALQYADFSAGAPGGSTLFNSTGAPQWVRVANLNGAGGLDVAFGGVDASAAEIFLYVANGNAMNVVAPSSPLTFYATLDIGKAVKAFAIGDIDLDDIPGDFAVLIDDFGSAPDFVRVYFHDSDVNGNPVATWTAAGDIAVASPATSLALGDLNADGLLDIATSSQAAAEVTLLTQVSSTRAFLDHAFVQVAGPSYVVLEDLDGDDHADIIAIDKSVTPPTVTCTLQQ